MKYIALTRGVEAIVDDEDYESLNRYNWICDGRGYASRSVKIDGKKTRFAMHRCIVEAPDGMDVDHINGNRVDNRRENLRIVRRCQNRWNSRVANINSTGAKGVNFRKDLGQFIARISVDGIRHNLGRFDTLEEAEKAYDAAAVRFHGEFALTNKMLKERGPRIESYHVPPPIRGQRKHKQYGPPL